MQAGVIRVIGTFTYRDYANVPRSLVWARVYICDREQDGQDYILRERFTDMNGYFDSGLIVNDDGPGENGLDIVIYVFAWNWAVQIINSSGTKYYVQGGPWNDCPDGALLNVTANFIHGAWMIFSYHNGITAGWNYLNSSVSYDMPMATAVWPYNTSNPFYDAENEMIFLPDWAVHPDITLHEYAHYVMNITYGYMPPASGQYSINGTSDTNTAWVEGWAFFFPLVVQNDPSFLDLNLETPHWCSPNWDDGDQVVGRVAGALWDIFDSQEDGYDTYHDGFTHIWNIMETTPCDTLHDFWQAWNTSGYPKQSALMSIFQNSIDYRGTGDVNADGIVDIYDLTAVTAIFGAQKGDPNWDQLADLDRIICPDLIDIYDVVIVALNYGKYYDP
jgi:hypothetical protein